MSPGHLENGNTDTCLEGAGEPIFFFYISSTFTALWLLFVKATLAFLQGEIYSSIYSGKKNHLSLLFWLFFFLIYAFIECMKVNMHEVDLPRAPH